MSVWQDVRGTHADRSISCISPVANIPLIPPSPHRQSDEVVSPSLCTRAMSTPPGPKEKKGLLQRFPKLARRDRERPSSPSQTPPASASSSSLALPSSKPSPLQRLLSNVGLRPPSSSENAARGRTITPDAVRISANQSHALVPHVLLITSIRRNLHPPDSRTIHENILTTLVSLPTNGSRRSVQRSLQTPYRQLAHSRRRT